jgi:LPXTG-motif cell wall-anchored protein
MRAKSLRLVLMAVVVMIALLVAVVPSFAQSGSAGSMTGMNNWQTLQPGQAVEYRLNFLGSDTGPVTVMVGSNPSTAISFNVYTDQAWSSSGDPIGKGTVQNTTNGNVGATPSPLFGSDLIWQTNGKAGGLYHIQITNTAQQAAQFWIDATGAGNGGLNAYSAAAASATATTGITTTTRATGTTATTGTTGTTAQGPKTLPVTGDSSNLVVYLSAGLALIAAGWLATRKATQR